MGMVFLVGCALLALGAVLYWLDRLLLWMERRGWVYWRMTKRSTGPGVGNALLEIQTLMQPAARHLLELRQEVKEDSPESGDPPSDDTAPGPPEPSNTRSRTLSRNLCRIRAVWNNDLTRLMAVSTQHHRSEQ